MGVQKLLAGPRVYHLVYTKLHIKHIFSFKW